MTETNLSAKSYLDFAGLGELRSRAKNNEESAAQEVGRQFEAMFVQMVFKSVREANEPMKSDLMGSSSVDTFEQMYHQELSQVMSQKGVFGLGDWLTEQVKTQTNSTKAMDAYQQLTVRQGRSSLLLNPIEEQSSLPLHPQGVLPAAGIKL